MTFNCYPSRKKSTLPLLYYSAPLFALTLLMTGCGIFGGGGASSSGIISTYAGTAKSGFSGDGGQATSAELSLPGGAVVDTSGNLFIADTGNQRVREVSAAGVITTVAGKGTSNYSGDGGPATSAELSVPSGVAVDASGNIFIADYQNCRIRKVTPAGVISTAAGTGVCAYKGDGGQATSAALSFPRSVCIDASGNIYIADYGNMRVRKISTSGVITTLAGNGTQGFTGDGGPATAAELNHPNGVAVDKNGNVYIADFNNNRIRRVDPSGVISTFAGSSSSTFGGDGGPATSAGMSSPWGVGVDSSGNVYIASWNDSRVRMVNTSGVISTFAGIGEGALSGSCTNLPVGDGCQAASAVIYAPNGVTADLAGNIYIAETGDSRIRKVNH